MPDSSRDKGLKPRPSSSKTMFMLDRCISHKVSKDPAGALPPGAIPLARGETSKSF